MGSFGHANYSSGHSSSPPSLKHEPSISQMPPNTLQPTWRGYVADTSDALALFQGAIDGILRKVVRRPHDRERPEVICSGSVFIYEESASGIKRWTDGVPWSPSRILGNFLIYRELEKPFPPGEKKRATKKMKSSRPGAPYPSRGRAMDEMGGMGGDVGDGTMAMMPSGSPTGHSGMSSPISLGKQDSSGNSDRDSERSLVGSLTDSYAFKEGGLVKKTLSINWNEGHLHLVSYYTPDDVKNERLPTRSQDPRISHIQVRPELIRQQNFRTPVEGSEDAGPVSPTASNYRSSMPNQYMNTATSPSVYSYPMATQQQSIAQQPSSFYNPMGPSTSAYQYPQAYSHTGNFDFGRSMASAVPGSAAAIAQHYHSLPQNPQMSMHAEQSSYVQQSSYQMQDPRSPQNANHYGVHFKQEWDEGQNR